MEAADSSETQAPSYWTTRRQFYLSMSVEGVFRTSLPGWHTAWRHITQWRNVNRPRDVFIS